jgi:predicted GNAT family N-acyltransferase
MLASAEELIESYRLRHDVYRALGYLQRTNQTRLDVDEYDSSAIPLGAFDAATGAMIGTLRIVMTQPQLHYDYLLRGIVASCYDDDLARQAWGPQPHPLPSIVNEEIDRQVDEFNTEHLEVRELSRCIVHPERRGEGISRALMEFALACIVQSGHSVVIGSCLPMHVPMYAKYGYTTLPGLNLFESVGQIAKAVICRTDIVPEPARRHIDEIVSNARAGRPEYVRELDSGVRFVHRFTAPRRARRRTIEW